MIVRHPFVANADSAAPCLRLEALSSSPRCAFQAKADSMTPADTRYWTQMDTTGVSENQKTPGNPGVFRVFLLYEAAALTSELRRQGFYFIVLR
jgi:hypothetical protein